jgi:hypothetical protein
MVGFHSIQKGCDEFRRDLGRHTDRRLPARSGRRSGRFSADTGQVQVPTAEQSELKAIIDTTRADVVADA